MCSSKTDYSLGSYHIRLNIPIHLFCLDNRRQADKRLGVPRLENTNGIIGSPTPIMKCVFTTPVHLKRSIEVSDAGR